MTDELPFGSSKDKHELSHLYETKIKNMGNAGRNGGQYYTPRPLIRAIIRALPFGPGCFGLRFRYGLLPQTASHPTHP